MILLIDPAHEPVRVAVADGGRIVASQEIAERREQSAKLLSAVDAVLTSAAVAPADLSAIAVVRGPGPFTSLRIALASANALAQAADIPMVGVTANQASTIEELGSIAAARLTEGQTDTRLLPEYGAPPSITQPPTESD